MKTFVFGFGSLMNDRTHTYREIYSARLPGWRRHWCVIQNQQVAALTVVPDPEQHVRGLMAAVPEHEWPALDRRERGYQRVDVTDRIDFRAGGHGHPVMVYAVPAHSQSQHRETGCILLSYLDVVVQGHLRKFGQDFVDDFFRLTTGWDIPIYDDRARPVYPRAQGLTASEIAAVDNGLHRVGARWADIIAQPLF